MVFAGVLWLSYGYQTDRQTASQAGRQTQTDRPTGRQPRRRRGREREREKVHGTWHQIDGMTLGA